MKQITLTLGALFVLTTAYAGSRVRMKPRAKATPSGQAKRVVSYKPKPAELEAVTHVVRGTHLSETKVKAALMHLARVEHLITQQNIRRAKQLHVIPDHINRYELKAGCVIGIGFGAQALAILKDSNVEHMHAIDPYILNPDFISLKSQLQWDVLYHLVHHRLHAYTPRVTMMREPSTTACKQFENNSLDFICLNANHMYDLVKQDLHVWWDKIRDGGYLFGDNYNVSLAHDPYELAGIKRAVDEFAKEKKLKLTLIGPNTYAIRK